MRTVRAVLVLLAFLVSVPVAEATVISIADARSQPPGTVVTVEGSVIVPSGTYSSSTFDQGFGIQDETAGIYVSTASNPNLHLHRRVRVTGEVADDGFGQLIIRPASLAGVKKLPGAALVLPASEETGAIGEDTEGRLVKITGTVTRPIVNDLPFGYQVFVDDGSGETQIFIPASTGINPFNIPFIKVGVRITAVGQSSQFLAQNEVLPRRRADLRRAIP